MKILILAAALLLQMVIWPTWCLARMRSNTASICYLATIVAFALGWVAR